MSKQVIEGYANPDGSGEGNWSISRPVTEAGRDWWDYLPVWFVGPKGTIDQEGLDHNRRRILAIEAEAAARIFAALPAALEAPSPDSGVSLYDLWSTENYSFESPQEVAAALIAAIEKELEKG